MTMRQRLTVGLLGLLALVSVSCIQTVTAQTLPVTRTLVWDAYPASDQITGFTVRLDGTVIGSPAVPSQSVTFTTLGSHTLTVTASNLFTTSPPASLTVNVVVPSAPANPRLTP